MVRLTDVSASANKVALARVSLQLSAGVAALLGAPTDGTSLLLSVMAGAIRASRGSVRVVDLDPTTPAARRAIGYVPLQPALPEALRVDEAISLLGEIRGAPADAKAALARFGLDGLASATVRELSRTQARAVALAEAVASPAVRVLLLDEPFVAMEPSAVAVMRAALSSDPERCVVISTASPTDARELASTHVVLSAGHVARLGASHDLLHAEAQARLVALADDPRALVAALAVEAELLSLEVHGRAVVVTAPNLDTAARAMGRAVVASGTSIESLSTEQGAS